ncbi:hypothetical protein DPV78_009828 [Talaromyces pinophilus]|nr:hypothetical protein DPV78_009828 [Talaromyces pinophilus]
MASSSSASAELSTEVSTPMASATANLSPEDLKQLFIDVITTANERRLGAVGNQFLTMDQLKDLIETILDKLIQAKADPAAEDKKKDKETEDDKTKSSRELPPTSEIKIVNEM